MVKTTKQKHDSYSGFLGAHAGAAPLAPANTVLPAITGAATVGTTLTASSGTWTGRKAPALYYEWLRGTTPIPGVDGSTYTLAAADVGARIRVRVTGENWAGKATVQSAQTAVVA